MPTEVIECPRCHGRPTGQPAWQPTGGLEKGRCSNPECDPRSGTVRREIVPKDCADVLKAAREAVMGRPRRRDRVRKPKTRRSISIKGLCYQRLKKFCDHHGRSVSGFLEDIIDAKLTSLNWPIETVLEAAEPKKNCGPVPGFQQAMNGKVVKF